jgi:hypothetical protein
MQSGGFNEELQEITYSAGAEYLYTKILLHSRFGYFMKAPLKVRGNFHTRSRI